LAQDELILGGPDLPKKIKPIHELRTIEKERAFGQLVTKETVDEIQRVGGNLPAVVHENWREKRKPHPDAINNQKKPKPVAHNKQCDEVNAFDNFARRRAHRRLCYHFELALSGRTSRVVRRSSFQNCSKKRKSFPQK